MWQQLMVTVDEDLAEDVSDALMDAGALSVSFLDAGDQPLFEPPPGTTPVWAQTRVVGLFEEGGDLAAIRSALGGRFGDERLRDWSEEALADQVWERTWLEHFRPMRFGSRLWVCPTGFTVEDTDAVVMSLDPGLAFGTGTHPTTALCLEWLDAADLQGASVLDYGCGSGILGIAAALLGAAGVHAVDIDPQALAATVENARKNRVGDRIEVASPGGLADFDSDIALANILANPLMELADALRSRVRPGGRIVLSGILAEQADAVASVYARKGFEMEPAVFREGWVRLAGVRRT
ncbi:MULTISPECIES: 50S ribosomal protein L11 methyltransferase [Methylococcus]|uniref:Ribosomal protein L11 methyltransferase n=1 Tax=Methylococcus capsulatus (strain ATCC 33009 / NCIMB 11132 / Bath) TaxID=243233 RepID=PRMA_METCA|nr:50S ribosomal protein L11 methyltransferase [Methylococcus capsulatus]Q60A25.1 RecName: Full=Ribosomal protein L11 methyltransferase; Short=L11 Mtase [Methylococcus capsulatus str. Bath]AAU92846.1 ribosomal protein L11 methyltransferase [Methylococcus capsulatus str. Bath]